MKIKVSFLPLLKPTKVKTVSSLDKVKTLLSEAKDVIASVVKSTSEDVARLSLSHGVVIGHEDFFRSGCKNVEHGCIPQAEGIDFFVNELGKISAQYPNVLIIPGSIYLSVDKLNIDKKNYRQNGSKNYLSDVYVQNVVPVFYMGNLIRLIKKGDYLQSLFRTGAGFNATLIKSEEEFIQALTSNCERMDVKVYAEDELEDMVPRVVMFGKTPLPGEISVLQKHGLTHEDLFSPIFTVKGVHYGIEICADHQRAKMGSIPQLENLDVHILTCYGQTPLYDGTLGQGFFIRADLDSCTIFDMRKNDAGEQVEQSLPLELSGGEAVGSRFSMFPLADEPPTPETVLEPLSTTSVTTVNYETNA
ncbi:hypothetical protein [Legionella hackeliae]|uniref:Uncharacterized protein n=1 Tax=Legionella hackeliae TaxID=449 RepID=A0A0A8ULR9_LEGHA|nr:hypothetical protein [Legionella hackeliae]KTD10164.1 hypothetical protein Lhac_2532 [Legionella hackeliae]CEK09658.1 protein of unknown function [Legionella hackeliae]STX49569.1 Uncharacterised protein [Legionella hackeliae]